MENDKVQPGQTIAPTPAGAPEPPQPPVPPAPQPPASEPPVLASPPDVPPAPDALSEPVPESDTDQQFAATPEDVLANTGDSDQTAITWTASEFIAHAKSFGWYLALAAAAVIGAVLVYLLTRDPISSGVIIVAAIFLGIYAGHKPRELQYRLDSSGLSIGQKHFKYHQFKSFAILPEGAFSSIVFMPLKRFAVATTVYCAPEDEDRIASLLGSYLPLEEHGHDPVDRLMHRIHF